MDQKAYDQQLGKENTQVRESCLTLTLKPKP